MKDPEQVRDEGAEAAPRPFLLALKRAFDFLAAAFLLALALPLLLGAALAVKLDSRGPVFFRQERIGRGGRPFTMWKFRSMVVGAVNQGAGYLVVRDDPRITAVGKWLRRFSLDELPQLLNVLLGEMSLVGPRPSLPYQVEQYDSFQRQRLQMRPGITGLAQVTGRNELSWPERIRLDVWYVQHWSLLLDLRILGRTAGVVLGQAGTYTDDLSKFEVRDSASHEASSGSADQREADR